MAGADRLRLPLASVDVALLVPTYPEIDQPFCLPVLLPTLRPGGRVAILDADRVTSQYGTPPALLECELAVFTPPARIAPCRDGAAR